jgi:hypothetical protein
VAETISTIDDVLKALANALAQAGSEIAGGNLGTSSIIVLLQRLGWNIPFGTPIGGSASSLVTAAQQARSLASSENVDTVALAGAIRGVVTELATIADDLDIGVANNIRADLAQQLPRQLCDLAVIRVLETQYPRVHAILTLLGVIYSGYEEATSAHRRNFLKKEMRWTLLRTLLSDPSRFLEHAFGWGTPAFDGGRLLDAVELLCRSFGMEAGRSPSPSDVPAPQQAQDGSLFFNFVEWPELSIGAELYRLSDDAGTIDVGIAIAPYIASEASGTFELDDGLSLTLDGALRLSGDVGLEFRRGQPVHLFVGGTPLPDGRLSAKLLAQPEGGLLTFGDQQGTHFSIPNAGVELAIDLMESSVRTAVALLLRHVRLVIARGNADGFVARLLPADPVESELDLEIGLDQERGFYFKGGGTLELTIPVHLALGPINIQSIYLAAGLADQQIAAAVGTSFSGSIGPITVAVERVGVRFVIDESPNASGIDLGALKLRAAFLPPTGAGIAVDAGGITGGGFLEHKEEDSSYAGVLALNFGDIALTAVGLITTKLPSGNGYALFLNIGVTFSPVIQLPYNFNLSGCGGLLAINRTFDVEAMRSGLKNHTLDSILFPPDPIKSASKIISDSEMVFPIEEGRFVIGPMAKFGWSAQNIIMADVAIVIEIPQPVTIALLGKITAKFPKPENAKCVLHLDVLGVIEFEKKEFAIDASLYDSHIASYDISGDSAMRLNWGTNKWAMSVGGFHPKFSPPPKFPTLGRVKLQLKSSDSFDLSCTAYQALTSNTLQFGAALRLHAEACGVELDGGMSADTLFVFSPFHFTTDIHAHLSAEYKGFDIASVSLGMDLSGPSPWHAKGKAKVSVSRFSTTARFSKTWGSDNAISLPSVNPEPLFIAELGLEGNWGSALIPGVVAVEALASPIDKGTTVPATDTTPEQPFLVLHPGGGLQLTQRLLPLDIKLEKFGSADVTGPSRFDFRLQLGAATLEITAEDVEDYFARGQFKHLSKSERLSKPSYERFLAGKNARPSFPGVDGRVEPCPLEYESILFGIDNTASAQQANAAMPWTTFGKTASAAAWRHHALRNRGSVRFSVPGGGPRVGVAEEAYVIVQKATLTRAMEIYADTKPLNQTKAEELLKEYEAANPATAGTAAVVPEFEVQEA